MVSPTTLKVDIVDKKRYPSANESGLENVSGGKRRKKECTTPSDGAVNEGKGNSTTAGFSSKERETDPHRIRQRSKQVEYGKNTVGYDRYTHLLHRNKRRLVDPHTPDVYKKMSKRAFEGLCREWRRKLHEWDEPTDERGIAVAREIMQLNKEVRDAEEDFLPDSEPASNVPQDISVKGELDANSTSEGFSSGIYCETTALDTGQEATVSKSHVVEFSDAGVGTDTGAVLSDDDLL